MKTKFINILVLFLGVCFSILSGCSHATSVQLVNEMHFDVNGISDITISYDEENITFFESESQELVVKEYMSKNKSSYYADVKQSQESIYVSEGEKPFSKSSFIRYIEVYLPKEYQESLTVTTTNGDIDLKEMNLHIKSLCIDSTEGIIQLGDVSASTIQLSSTSGQLELGDITGEQIKIDTTSGKVMCGKLSGTITYTSTSGDFEVESASGSGSYQANNSGKMKVVYKKVTGNLSLCNKNDSIELILPKDLEFVFEATTKNGMISTSFQEAISVNETTAQGLIGSNPTLKIELETRNGDIEVTQ